MSSPACEAKGSERETLDAARLEVVAGWLGQRPRAIVPVRGGGNNRVFRVELPAGSVFALKRYPNREIDGRDRLGTEFAALSFLAGQGVDSVPRPVAADPPLGLALYEWIEGDAVTDPGGAEIDAAVAFVARLAGLRGAVEAAALPAASEACLSGAEILAQIDRRRLRFDSVLGDHPDLARFLQESFDPAWHRIAEAVRQAYAGCGWEFEAEITPHQRTLSPSDFGFHNAVRRADHRLVFIDFEYFGWDDPVRLAADFLQHPGMVLDEACALRYRSGLERVFAGDRDFALRLALLYPLIGLRWCMILLNEFLPERWRGRRFAGVADDQARATRRQLDKAQRRLAAVECHWNRRDWKESPG